VQGEKKLTSCNGKLLLRTSCHGNLDVAEWEVAWLRAEFDFRLCLICNEAEEIIGKFRGNGWILQQTTAYVLNKSQ